ncbi:hypothetical protein CDH05_09065 [Pseudomonas lactis]|nr:hypothetical protein CDH05_09065 [Pseudomonas lactis]
MWTALFSAGRRWSDPGCVDRSHAPRGNAFRDAPRHLGGRRASQAAYPRRAWERSMLPKN